MKFANIYWQNTEMNKSKMIAVNIGDNLQFLAIDYLYAMFMPEIKNIERIQMKEIKNYRGETLILPMNWSLFDSNYMVEDKISISEDIIPVFLGMTIQSATYREEYFNNYNVSYLRRFEPIGCRDECTMKILQKYNIRAYLNGCLTAILPKREKKEGQDKIFFVDVPIAVKEYLPEEIEKNYLVMTQQYYYSVDTDIGKIIDDVKKQYRIYANEARLVVSSRLHVISPCMAMGIPVIFTKNQIDARFGWIDQMLPLYDKNNYNKIDWNPDPIEYEKEKNVIISNAVERIKSTYKKYALSNKISDFYEGRKRRSFIDFRKTIYENFDNAMIFLQKKYQKCDRFVYSIWGINSAAEKFYSYMCREYPNAIFKDAIDSYKLLEFHGKITVTPGLYQNIEGEIVFVLTVAAANTAEKLFAEKGMDKESYVCCGERFIQ